MSCGELFVNLGGGGSYTPPNGMLQTASALSNTPQVVKDNLGNSSSLSLATQGGTNPSAMNYGSILAGSGNGYYFSSIGSGIGGYGAVGSNYYWKVGIGFVRTHSDSSQKLQFSGNNNFSFDGGASGTSDTLITFTSYFGRNVNGYYLGVYGSTITQNGALTILNHSTGNIASFRDNSNVEKLSIDNGGVFNSPSNLVKFGTYVAISTNLNRIHPLSH